MSDIKQIQQKLRSLFRENGYTQQKQETNQQYFKKDNCLITILDTGHEKLEWYAYILTPKNAKKEVNPLWEYERPDTKCLAYYEISGPVTNCTAIDSEGILAASGSTEDIFDSLINTIELGTEKCFLKK